MTTLPHSPHDPGANRTHDLRFRKPGPYLRDFSARSVTAGVSGQQPEAPHKVSTKVLRLSAMLALALSGCTSSAAPDVGYRVAQYNFPDAGVSCWLYKAEAEMVGSLSCVRVSP